MSASEPLIDYRAFCAGKEQGGSMDGFDPLWMPDFLFDFQRSLVEWALLKGRCALFEDCGQGTIKFEVEEAA